MKRFLFLALALPCLSAWAQFDVDLNAHCRQHHGSTAWAAAESSARSQDVGWLCAKNSDRWFIDIQGACQQLGGTGAYRDRGANNGWRCRIAMDEKLKVTYERELEFWKIVETADNRPISGWLARTEELLLAEGQALFAKGHPYHRLAHVYMFGCVADTAPSGGVLPPLKPFRCNKKFRQVGGHLWESTGNDIMEYMLEILSFKTMSTFDYQTVNQNLEKMMALGPKNVEGYVVTAMMLSILNDRNGSNNLRRAIEIMDGCRGEICTYSPTPMAPSKKLGMSYVLAEMLYLEGSANKDQALGLLEAVKPIAKIKGQLQWIDSLEKAIHRDGMRVNVSPALVRYPVPTYFRRNACMMCHAGAAEVFQERFSRNPRDIMKMRYH